MTDGVEPVHEAKPAGMDDLPTTLNAAEPTRVRPPVLCAHSDPRVPGLTAPVRRTLRAAKIHSAKPEPEAAGERLAS